MSSCPKEGLVARLSSLNMGVQRERVYFVICPKQGPKMDGDVLHRGGILGFQALSGTPIPKYGLSST